MNLSYDTEQIILADSAEKFLSSRCGYASFQKIAQGAGWDSELWSEFAALGWLGVPFAEADGGVGAGPVEVAILMEAFGRHLVLAPYLSCIVLGGGIVAKLGTADQRRALLGPVIAGKSFLAFAPGESDAPVEARKTASGFVLSGRKKTVLGAAMAEILLVTAKLGDGAGVFIVPAKARGVTMRGYRMVDGARAADVELVEVIVPADALLGGNDDAANAIEETIDRGIAALSSDAVGAMSALVSATVEYTKTRVQFGQPIAKFQVLQHRMVDMKVKEEEARASCLFATLSLDGPADRRARACSGAKAKIGRMARIVGQEAIQLHGAIGTTEELPIGGYVKRLIAYEILFGSTRAHLNRYAGMIADPDVAKEGLLLEAASEERGVDLTIAREELAFRDEVRRFLEANIPRSVQRKVELTTAFLTEPDISLDFHKALHKKGWSVFNWPKEYGGTGWTAVQRYIFDTECARYNAPTYNGAGRMMLAPVLMKFGRQDQKDFYLPRIASGEDHWAQGYSEPGAGSDLASLKTKAESDGDHYIVNGQKIWTTLAHKSNRIFALVRTSSEGKRQEGITFLLIDMDTPGITVRPILGNGGDHEFNEVFFDNVRVPKSNRVGEENKGWDCAKYLLEFERGGSLVAGRVRAQFTHLVEQVKRSCPADREIAVRLGELGTDLDAMEMIDISILSKLQSGSNPGAISSLVKMRWSQIRQQITELALDAADEEALEWIAARPLYETLERASDEEEILSITPRYLNYRAYTIFGGSTEIQTTIIAKSMLGL